MWSQSREGELKPISTFEPHNLSIVTHFWGHTHTQIPSLTPLIFHILHGLKVWPSIREHVGPDSHIFPGRGHTLPSQINISELDNLPRLPDWMRLCLSSPLVHVKARMYRTDLHGGSRVQALMHRDLHRSDSPALPLNWITQLFYADRWTSCFLPLHNRRLRSVWRFNSK